MYTIARIMGRTKQIESADNKKQVWTLRLKAGELPVFSEVWEKVHARTPAAKKSDLLRELIGLEDKKLLKPKEREMLLQRIAVIRQTTE